MATNLKDKNEKDKLKGRTREKPILGPRGQASANYFFFSYFFLFGSKFDVHVVLRDFLELFLRMYFCESGKRYLIW